MAARFGNGKPAHSAHALVGRLRGLVHGWLRLGDRSLYERWEEVKEHSRHNEEARQIGPKGQQEAVEGKTERFPTFGPRQHFVLRSIGPSGKRSKGYLGKVGCNPSEGKHERVVCFQIAGPLQHLRPISALPILVHPCFEDDFDAEGESKPIFRKTLRWRHFGRQMCNKKVFFFFFLKSE